MYSYNYTITNDSCIVVYSVNYIVNSLTSKMCTEFFLTHQTQPYAHEVCEISVVHLGDIPL